jgi:hypothetical protein
MSQKTDQLLKWAGLAIMFGALGLGLAGAGQLMQPIKVGTAADFWSSVWGVPLEPGQEAHSAFQAQAGVLLYGMGGEGFPLHGDPLWIASPSAVLAAFPAAIDRLLADPSKLTDAQIGALVGEKAVGPDTRTAVLVKLAGERNEIGRSLDRMQAFLEASTSARLESKAAGLGPTYLARAVEEAAWIGSRVDRSRHYWANIVFEAVFLGGAIVLFWLPILYDRLRRRLPLIWGGLILVLLVPYYLGYCRVATCWPNPDFWGGALYPWLLQYYRPLAGYHYAWEASVLGAIGWVLEPLNSSTWFELNEAAGGFEVGLVAPTLIAAAVAGILYMLDAGFRRLMNWLKPAQM